MLLCHAVDRFQAQRPMAVLARGVRERLRDPARWDRVLAAAAEAPHNRD